MRPVTLAKVAAQAEILRLRRMARRQVMRAVYGAVAAVFAVGVLVLLHVVAFHAMVPRLSPLVASAILLAADLVIAGVLGYLAMRNTPDQVERDAKQVRDQAVTEMQRLASMATMVGPVRKMLGTRRTAGLAFGALATKLLARRT